MTSHLPNDYAEDRVRRSLARQSDELRHMLTAIKTDWQRELTNISMAAFWPDIERAVIALNDSDANRRSNAVDRLLDGIERAVQTCHTRLAKCDAAAGPVHRSVHK